VCPSVVVARKSAFSSLHQTLINSSKKLGDVCHRIYEMGNVFLIKNDIEIRKLSLLEVLVYVVLGIWMTTESGSENNFPQLQFLHCPIPFFSFFEPCFSFLSKLMGIDVFA
jgi:hypothetical protein